MWQKIFNWIADRLIAYAMRRPYFHLIHRSAGEPYMDRYWLMPMWMLRTNHFRREFADGSRLEVFFEKRFEWLPSIRIHHIRSSDWARALHDHPWGSISLILRGSYIEVTPRNQAQFPYWDRFPHRQLRSTRTPGAIRMRRATDRHRLIVANGSDGCWSMFMMWRNIRRWGFHTEKGWIDRRDYFEDRKLT